MIRLDLIIFGATGFTGKYVVTVLLRSIIENYPDLKWGVAGRSLKKLELTLEEISKKIDVDISSVPKIVANVDDRKSLEEMCRKCKVLANCCGPYRLYGEPVVRAALAAHTHYVDVCGEPQFMEKMQLEYDAQARDAGVYVVSACGFDSVPADLGVVYMQQKFYGTLNSVESYLVLNNDDDESTGLINYGTWESLIYGLQHHGELYELRKKLYPNSLPQFRPKLKARSLLHRRGRLWCTPFPFADASVVYRSQRRLWAATGARPAQIKTYMCFPSLLTALAAMLLMVLLFVFSKWSVTRALLLRWPGLWSAGYVVRGPTELATRFTEYTLRMYGSGWPHDHDCSTAPARKLSVQVSGVDPGYTTTAMCLLYSALMILNEKNKMPECGVLTPGYAFKDTSLILLLNQNDVNFEIINRSEM